ncbi:ankyrin repeat, SAM and basic leucine zipper domain-containing protein 1 [Onthophagus taurus]|uniref:ankyrin repeat, SAM and basic leucine zipper domain-containing protein 1 n=1 Tax=Onthophagus taurus TaxID=166361 RepID=UPI0039BE7E42
MMYPVPAGYSSDEDDYDYYSCNSFSTPASVKRNLKIEETDEIKVYRACIGGRFDEVKEILDRGYDVNSKLKEDWSLLLLAASIGSPDIVQLVLERGGDPNYSRDGYTALMATSSCTKETCSYEQSYKTLKILLNAGCDPTMINRKRMTALMYASSYGNCLIVEELLKSDNKEVEDNQGWTALFWAIDSNQVDVVKMLLNDGFICDKMDIRGETPTQIALKHGYEEIVKLLPSIDVPYENLTCYTQESFNDFFNKGCTLFLSDVCVILYGMNSENAIDKFITSRISLLEFLHINENGLKKIGVNMPYERYRILNGLYKFHKQPFRLKSIPIIKKNEKISLANVGTSILSACRQIVVMNASLKYLIENVNESELERFKKEILSLNQQVEKIEKVVEVLNKKCLLWDKYNYSPDLISSSSIRKIKSMFWKKIIYSFGFLSVMGFFVFKSRLFVN